jgi:hypothetical protein
MAIVMGFFVLLGISAAHAGGVELRIVLPAGVQAQSGEATAAGVKLTTPGRVEGQSVIFPSLLPDTAYTVRITTADGTVLQGVDLAWYNAEAPDPAAGALTEADLAEIRSIVTDVPSFYNKCSVVRAAGSHERATVLVQLVRDKDFHAGAGEVIWRMELWYFKYEAGGWAVVPQQNKVLQRVRFASHAAYHKATDMLQWVAELGGIRLSKEKPVTTRTIAAPTTRPQ